MRLDDKHHAFRRLLDEATEGVPDPEQPRRIADLAAHHPHSIQLALERIPQRRGTWVVNCHRYTFGLCDSPEVLAYTTRTVFPNAAYVASLIADVLIETDDPSAGDFVVYFKDGIVQHSGICTRGRVRSKRGTGHLWDHALHEVPFGYGGEVRFFRAVPAERCVEAFVAFAQRAQRDR